jgi:hypothetical protein
MKIICLIIVFFISTIADEVKKFGQKRVESDEGLPGELES